MNGTQYEALYAGDEYYWGTEPGRFCDELIALRPFPRAKAVLDIGCGEGKDAAYMASKGYAVSAFDIAGSGIRKALRLARERGVGIDAWVEDINDFRPRGQYDIVYSSGTIQYLRDDKKAEFFEKVRAATRVNGVAYFNVFVEKSFLALPPDWDEGEALWKPGELFCRLSDWKFLRIDETIFEDDSGGTPHLHCMDTILCERMS